MRTTNPRVLARPPDVETSPTRFADDVRYYLQLSPRQLPSRYLYDELGSALFDAICQLPWYELTRAEQRLLTSHGAAIWKVLAPISRVIELGSGSGEKLALLVRAAQSHLTPLQLNLVDVSARALDTAARLLTSFDNVDVITHQAPYEVGLEELRHEPRPSDRSLLLFLGSNIGNFDPPGSDALLRQIRTTLDPGDGFLIGTDLLKHERDLLLAYNDPLGVTAAFNRNLLVRINRELGADFDVAAFSHRAVWTHAKSRVEMHLISTRRQRIQIAAAKLDFWMAEGEHIWTESAYKYHADDVITMLERAGFRRHAQWIDEIGRFALTLVDGS